MKSRFVCLAAVLALAACRSSSGPAAAAPAGKDLPRVPTAALVRSLIDGQVPSTRFVDPALALAVFDGVSGCGEQGAASLRAILDAMKRDLASGVELICEDTSLADGGSAACATQPGEGETISGVRFVADTIRGLRLAGIESYESGTAGTEAHDTAFDAYLDQIATHAPCE